MSSEKSDRWINIIAVLAGCLVLVLFGAVFIIIGGRDIKHSHECLTWPETDGVIIESGVYERKDDDNSKMYYSPMIKYSFIVNGKKYTGDRKSYRSVEHTDRKIAEDLLTDYPKGASIRIFYKPEKPEFSVLERGEPLGNFVFYLGWFLVFLAIAIGLFAAYQIKSE